MKKVLDAFLKTPGPVHPIVHLLTIRSDSGYVLPNSVREFRTNPLFHSLPSFTGKQLMKLQTDLEKTSNLCHSLRNLPFRMQFSRDFLTDLPTHFPEGTEIPEVYQIVFLYQSLAWILATKNSETIKADILAILAILNRCCDSFFSEFCGPIFTEIVKTSIASCVFQDDEKVTELIFDHFRLNGKLGSDYAAVLMLAFDTIMQTKRKNSIEGVLGLLVEMFEQDRGFVAFSSFTHVLSAITEFFNALDTNAVLVTAYASRYSQEAIITDSFVVLPTLLFESFQEMPVRFEFKACDPEIGGEVERDDEETPKEGLVAAEGEMVEVCGDAIRDCAKRMNAVIAVATSEVVEAFVQSLSRISKILEDSPHAPDFLVMISLMLEELSRKAAIEALLPVLFRSCLFKQDMTIFARRGIPSELNLIRNDIFDIISNINAGLFYQIFEIISRFPFLTAESVMRLSFKLGNSFFAEEEFLGSLFNSLNMLQQKKTAFAFGNEKRARSVMLSILFNILDVPEMALLCFTKPNFATSFLNLAFDPDFSSTIIEFFGTCLSKFTTIPDAFVTFLSLLLSTCGSHTESDHFSGLGSRLIKGVNQALSHNPKLGVAFAGILDSSLSVVQNSHTKEDLYLVMSTFTFVTQSRKELKMTDAMFQTILNLRKDIEGSEPSDSFVLACLNLMNAATNVSLDLLFNIEIVEVIPLLICSFCESSKLCYVIDLFQKLCQFSLSNTLACHNGNLDLILLEGMNGEFTFRNKSFRFTFSPDDVEAALRLVGTIVSVRSSIEVDKKFVDLIMSHDLDVSKRALMTLYDLFSNQDNDSHEIWSPEPLYELDGTFGSDLKNGFAFSCYVKVDTSAGLLNEDKFVLLHIEDTSKRMLEISFIQESLVCRYENLPRRTTTTPSDKLPANKWVLITTFFHRQDGETVVVFRCGDVCSDDIKFTTVNFDQNVKVTLGATEKGTAGPGVFSPVSIGKFALFLISEQFDDQSFEVLHSNGFAELPNMPNLVFAYNSPECKLNVNACKAEMSITSLMPTHMVISDFTGIFLTDGCHKDPMLLELALTTFIRCTDFHNGCSSGKAFVSLIEDDQSPFPFLTKVTGIPDDFFKRYNCASSGCKFSMHLSEISIIISHILHSERCRLDSSLFPAFLEMIESTNDEELRLEVMENALINIWIWERDNPTHFKKISRQLTNYLSQFRFPEECELFTECLIQCHLFQNCSTVTVSVFQNVKMKLLEHLPLREKHLPCFVAVILSLKDSVQITDYLNLLLNKAVEIPMELLIELIDLVEFCDFNQASLILNLITLSTASRPADLQLCLVQMALKSSNMDIFQLIQSELDIFCIEALRTNSVEKLNQVVPSLALQSKDLWYFWPVLVTLYVDESVLDFIVTNLTSFNPQQFPTHFTQVLNFLAILRSTRAFPNILDITKSLICRVLDFVLSNKSNFTKSAVKQILLRAFLSVYYKLMATSTSSALLRLWNDSPFGYPGDAPSGAKEATTSEFSYENLKRVLRSDLSDMKFRFWQSHSKEFDTRVTKLILVLIHAVFGDSDEDKTITLIRSFIAKKSQVFSCCEVFDFFCSNPEMIDALTQQVKTTLTEINSYLNPNLKSHFNRHEILTSFYNSERMRLKKIYQCVEYEDLVSTGISPRFARFPLVKFERTNWQSNEHDTFTMMKSQQVVEDVTIVHSSPCKMVTIFGRINVTFILLSNEIRISQIGKPVISIKFEAVNVVLSTVPKYVEFYTSACQSTLLCFSNDHYSTILEKLRTCPLKLITNAKDGKAKILHQWAESKISNLDLILGLNFMSGRSFNDIYNYPMAPIIVDGKFCSTFNLVDNKKYITTVSRWLLTLNLVRNDSLPDAVFSARDELAVAINGPGCVPPQLYFSFYSFDKSLHSHIYLARRSMDNDPEVQRKIHAWVEVQFNVTLPVKEVFLKRTDVTLQSMIRHKKEIVNASFFSNTTKMFFVQFSDGMIEIYVLSLSSGSPAVSVIRKFSNPFVFEDEFSFCALRNKLLLFDWKNCLTYRINERCPNDKVITSIPITSVAPLGDYVIFVVDWSLLCMSLGDQFPLTRRVICAESERILIVQTSLPFQMVVYVTESQEMKIISIFSSRVIGRLAFPGETVVKILVTDNLGFIVVKTDKKIYTCSANGSVLSCIDFALPVRHWIAHTVKGIDWLILIDGENNLMYCEAFYLTRMITINRIKKSIITMTPSSQTDTLIMISSDSKVIMFPLPF